MSLTPVLKKARREGENADEANLDSGGGGIFGRRDAGGRGGVLAGFAGPLGRTGLIAPDPDMPDFVKASRPQGTPTPVSVFAPPPEPKSKVKSAAELKAMDANLARAGGAIPTARRLTGRPSTPATNNV